MTTPTMATDAELLRQFKLARSESAFAELVRRYVDLVYTAARRQLKDPADVDDVTQAVFVLLGQKAGGIRDGAALAGWLLVTTRFVALNHLRTEARRRRRETEAAAMRDTETSIEPSDDPTWDAMQPVLDQAVAALRRGD